MIPDWAPSIHPLVVHFPIVLFILAVTVDLLSYAFRNEAMRTATALLYAAAGAAALAAFLSGRQAADLADVSVTIVDDLNAHADWGKRTAWFTGIVGLLRLVWLWIQKDSARLAVSRVMGLTLTAAGVLGLFLVWQTAERGAKLVFLHGVGGARAQVDPLERFSAAPPSGGAPTVLDDGSWSWTPPSDLKGFIDALTWIEGDPASTHFGTRVGTDGNVWLTVESSGPTWFALPQRLHGVEAIALVDFAEFDGEIDLTYNTIDTDNYGAIQARSSGRLTQVVVAGGNRSELDSGSADFSRIVSLRAISSGTHYRSYVNDQLATHGHATALKPGFVGFRIRGAGPVRIGRLAAVSSGGDHH